MSPRFWRQNWILKKELKKPTLWSRVVVEKLAG